MLVLLVARLVGASVELAINLALLWTIATLVILGALAGSRSNSRRLGSSVRPSSMGCSAFC
jgi:hypothetical protein